MTHLGEGMKLEEIKSIWKLREGDIEAEIAAWDSTAEEYVYEKKNNFQEDPFLHFMAEKIQFEKQMHTLDVGCGAGAYSVELASKVAQADGVDLSPRMVELGNAYATEHGITNLKLWVHNWHTDDISDLEGKYDVVFAHTTPAVADYETLVKMCKVSKNACFLCKPARRTDMVFDEIKRIAGVTDRLTGDDSVAYAFDTLWGLGYNPEVSYAQTVWLPRKTLEEATKWYLGRLHGYYEVTEAVDAKVKDYLKSIAKDGIVEERIDTTLVNLYWRISG